MIQTWKSYHDLAHDVAHFAPMLPDYDLIVGLPRSGLFPALMISEMRSVDVSSLDYFLQFECGYKSGFRIATDRPAIKKVLIIDDSYSSGAAHRRAVEMIEARGLDKKYQIDYAVIYGGWRMPEHIRYFCINRNPQIFEWHILTRENSRKWGVDIDGVLCPDPPVNEIDDPEGYLQYIKTAPIKWLPGFHIRAIITSRLDIYRRETEGWLASHGIKYDRLCMTNYSSANKRRKARRWAQDKIQHLIDMKCNLMVESDIATARAIGEYIPCICTGDMKLYKILNKRLKHGDKRV